MRSLSSDAYDAPLNSVSLYHATPSFEPRNTPAPGALFDEPLFCDSGVLYTSACARVTELGTLICTQCPRYRVPPTSVVVMMGSRVLPVYSYGLEALYSTP